MIKTCKHCGITGEDGIVFHKKIGLCRDCERIQARERMAAWRLTSGYTEWLQASRESRKANKEKYRRAKGIKSIEELKQEAAQKQSIKKLEKEQRRKELRKPWHGLSDTDAYRLRYALDPAYREKEKARTSETKKQVPLWYANQMLGGSKSVKYPEILLEVKRLHLLIKRKLEVKS